MSGSGFPATGHSGGIFLGVQDDTFEVDDIDRREFFVITSLTHRQANLSWEVIIVYGLTDNRRSDAFLTELKSKVERSLIMVVVGGDFNFIRSHEDKSSFNVYLTWMKLFNNCTATWPLERSLVWARDTPGLITGVT